MPDHFIIEDSTGRTISCSEERWFGHILKTHPEMELHENEVKMALKKPFGIYIENGNEEKEIFYLKPASLAAYLKVVVEFKVTGFGEVKTAYFTSTGKNGERLK